MSIAGCNVKVNIWRITTPDDDISGGALISGSVIYSNYPARIQQQPEQMLLLQQGLETMKVFTVTMYPGTLDIRERDELEVVLPTNYQIYGQRMRIINSRHADFAPSDPRNYMMLTVTRSVRSHANTKQ